MADKTPQDDIMPLLQMKQVLGIAEKEKLGCAFGLTKDKKDVLLLIDKRAKPKKVADQLKKDGKATLEVTSLRFGEVSIDVENDPGTVKFKVNRSEAGGTITAMVKLIKKAGYQGIVINADPSLEKDDAEETATASTSPPPPPPGMAAPPPPPPPPEMVAPIDADALKHRLTELVKRIPAAIAADPARKDGLLATAKQAQLMLGTNNLKAATEQTDALEKALDATTATAAPAAADGPFTKPRQIWLSTRQRVQTDLGKLRAALEAEFKDQPEGGKILQAYDGRVQPVLATLDEQLAEKLAAANAASDASARATLVGEAKSLMTTYTKYVENEALIGDLDDNPFTPLTIRKTVGATLTALAVAVH